MLSATFASLADKPPLPPDPNTDPVITTAGFLSWHPDLRFRLLGQEALRRDRPEDAFKYFRRAAFYADKPSQGMVAEMLWNGNGVERDRALAYAWMDLAAERGYRGFLALRERYWDELDETGRARAIEVGQEVYARYGDSAAKPRIVTQLRRGRRQAVGSRTGATGNVQIHVAGPSGYERIDGSKFYAPRYWDPEQYQQWHDAIWQKPRIGRVTVGDVEPDVGAAVGSRVPATAPDVDAAEPETPDVPDDVVPGTEPPPGEA